jgi:hypothetical protein
MLQIVCWVSGTHFWDRPVNEVPYSAIFERRNCMQRCIAACTKTNMIYSRVSISASLSRR